MVFAIIKTNKQAETLGTSKGECILKKKIPPIALVLVLILSLITGCTNAPDADIDGDRNGQLQEYIFVPEFTRIPDEAERATNFTYFDGKVYFTSSINLNDGVYLSHVQSTSKIYHMDTDGANFTALPGYAPTFPGMDVYGAIDVQAMQADDAGNMWIVESAAFWQFDLPDDFAGELWEEADYIRHLDSHITLRKLDNTGAEIRHIDLSAMLEPQERIGSFEIDSGGNLFLSVESHQDISRIYVLRDDGIVQFSLQSISRDNQLIPLADGTMAIVGTLNWLVDSMRKIDVSAGTWGSDIQLPPDTHSVYSGGGMFDALIRNDSGLFGFDAASGETVDLLNWIDADFRPAGVHNLRMLPDGRITGIETTSNSRTYFVVFTRVPLSDIAERTVLTLAAFGLDWVLYDAVIQFNRNNPTYRIQLIDYLDHATEDDFFTGLSRLHLEIITGNVPDILDVTGLPLAIFAARGLLVDLYELIDSDTELDRNSFVNGALRAAETNGSLYQIFPQFRISTIVGNPSALGTEPGWNMDEFMATVESKPQANRPLGNRITRDTFFETAMMHSINDFVDWSAATAHFDRGSFADLLEFSNTLPADWSGTGAEEAHELIDAGQQIMSVLEQFRGFDDLQLYRAMYGGDLVFKGFPADAGNGNALNINSGLAITTGSVSREGAWEFVRTFLTEEWQLEHTWATDGFPTNQAAFDARLTGAMVAHERTRTLNHFGFEIELEPTTQADADQVMALIDSMSGTADIGLDLKNIIMEGANDFFHGQSSLEDTIRIIQSRASVFVSEQSG